MSFCTFSKEIENSHTLVENKFITRYLPEADGFFVKVYLYGLYLCANADGEFSAAAMAEVLHTTEENIREAFAFWEELDLVEIHGESPLAVQYLPVKGNVGKPKKIHYERYAEFNKELQRKMQKIGKFISAGEYAKYMRFLEETSLQPQAFLLIAEYCINKQGESVSPSYLFNKAKKLIKHGATTYEQVERALSNYNAHESELIAVYNAMSIYQHTPDDNDYALYSKWTEVWGFGKDGILAAARKLKRGSITSLDLTLGELAEKGKLDGKEITLYLTDREGLANLAFRLGRKLGVKVQNPAPYIDEYVEKWRNYGFEENSLLDLALFCLKSEQGSFERLDSLLSKLFQKGILTADGVKSFLKEKNGELKLFAKMQEICGGLRKNEGNLALIKTWREWDFQDEMILEAARRSATSSNPIPYMNKILSEWKQTGVYSLDQIPQQSNSTGAGTHSSYTSKGFVSPMVEAANAKSARERYYSLLREKSQSRVEKALKRANANGRFKELTSMLSKMELSLAKAEMYEPSKLPKLQEEQAALLAERKGILFDMGIAEEELVLHCSCDKCQDTGFLPNGAACDCYAKAK